MRCFNHQNRCSRARLHNRDVSELIKREVTQREPEELSKSEYIAVKEVVELLDYAKLYVCFSLIVGDMFCI